MAKLLTALLTLLLLPYFGANAQSSFEEAFLVQNQDTIHGYIKSASDLELSKVIQFKTDLNSEAVREFYPGEVTAFYFKATGFYYASVKAEILKGSSKVYHHRFAKLLLSGFTSLYKLQLPEEEQSIVTLRNNTFLYILQKGTTYYTLGLYETMDGSYAIKNKRYAGMMRAAFSDCELLSLDLNQLNFDDKSMMKAVAAYNACMDPAVATTYYTYKAKAVIKHGVELSFAKLYLPKNPNNISAQGYSAGYFWDIIQPDASRKYSTKFGVTYMYYQLDRNSPNAEFKKEAVHYLRLPLAIQYNLKDPIVSETVPFFNIGFTAQITTNARYRDYIPLPSIGAGMYSKRFRFAALLENDGFKFSNPKLISLSVGMRLD
ncbi:hypothetical protein [uncultured Pontibacter sp.]|uniref:hypothetical protein n=1 Tax=uncultured Pontibacter sp. TaxID=453356 RepID=UPI00262FD38D|nr:hypothetical protein [uncultured Pontibacter sp.]